MDCNGRMAYDPDRAECGSGVTHPAHRIAGDYEYTYTDGTHDPLTGHVARYRTVARSEAEALAKVVALYPSARGLTLEASWPVRICARHYVSYRGASCFACDDEAVPPAIVRSPFVLRAMAAELPAKEYGL